jgi:CO/xanthine dehydrogenase Mo-binding subunit
LIGEGVFECKKDPEHPLGGPFPFYEFVVTGIELHIEPETGDVVVDRLVNVTDAGKIINPVRAVGVDEGGAVMGLGVSLSEQLLFDDAGHLLNASSLDYRIPRVVDIPEEFVTIFQENQDGPGPFGAKGMGEGAILAVAPALCGALYDATGIYLSELPLTPEKIWKALQSKSRKPPADRAGSSDHLTRQTRKISGGSK